MQILSNSHIECIINGHTFSGWASDDPPWEVEEEDAASTEKGADGGMYVSGMPALGGVFRFKMSPSSPTTQWAIQQTQLRKNAHKEKAALVVYSGTLSDPVQGVSHDFAGGVIMNFPAVRPAAGQTYEGSLEFEEITSNVDGGTFHPVGTSDT